MRKRFDLEAEEHTSQLDKHKGSIPQASKSSCKAQGSAGRSLGIMSCSFARDSGIAAQDLHLHRDVRPRTHSDGARLPPLAHSGCLLLHQILRSKCLLVTKQS